MRLQSSEKLYSKTLMDGERIAEIRRRYKEGPAFISVERARYYTESWKETEECDVPLPLRVSLAMKNVYEKMTHYLDPLDRIAGCWTEYFLGVPIPVERGEYNNVLEAELDMKELVIFRARSLSKGLVYMLRKGVFREFVKNQRLIRSSGKPPLNMKLKTMSKRAVNPYQIKPEDRKLLLEDILPYWKGRTIADILQKELNRAGLYSKDMYDFVVALPGNTSRQVNLVSTCATIATIQGHVILDYALPLRKGLLRMKSEIKEKIKSEKINKSQEIFLRSIETALEGILIFSQRLAERISFELKREQAPARIAQLEKMLAICKKVPALPAESFEEAVQSIWTVKTAVELANPINLHCFGRLDQILYPYYEHDLRDGKLSREDALELLEELLLKVMSQNIRPESNILADFYHRFLGSTPITLGGVTPEGEDAVNELTYLFLDAARNSKAVTNVSVRIQPHRDQALLEKIAEHIHDGTSNISLYNDEINIEAMKKRGFSEEDARDYAVMGCVELTSPGRTGGMSANALLLSKVLDITLRNGDSMTMAGRIKSVGLKTGEADSFSSFEELLKAFLRQGKHAIEQLVSASNIRDKLYAELLPAPYISVFIDGCVEKMKDVTRGGARYDISGISMINSVANVTDSLYAIKKLVYEEKKFTMRELIEGMDDNFIGYEDIHKLIRQLPGKWGNGERETDELAFRVTKALFDETYKYRNFKGGPFVVYMISMTTHTIDGRLSMATPDGRLAGTPFAASCNPFNVERNGVTAVLRSVAGLPFKDVMGCAVNVKFHPNAVGETPSARKKWASLVKTYFKMGGAQIQPTVASAETLREAQRSPQNYKDLIVKVGGYSTYFVELGREIQEEVIARTEHCS